MEKRVLVAILIIVSILIGVVAYSVVDNSPAELHLYISSDKTVYGPNESINVTVILKNTGDESITIREMKLTFGSLNLKLTTPNGTVLRYGGASALCLPEPFVLEGHHSVELKLNIRKMPLVSNESYWIEHINQTGTYHLQFVYKSEHHPDEDVWEGTVYSNTISFIISPEL